MSYSIYLYLAAATAGSKLPQHPVASAPDLTDSLQPALQSLRDLVERFRSNPIIPLATAQFEADLLLASRELARLATDWTYNHLEPADVQALRVILLSGVWPQVFTQALSLTFPEGRNVRY